MAKKKTAGQKAAETKAKKPVTMADIDKLMERAWRRLDKNPPDVSKAKMALSNARRLFRKACQLPALK